MPDIAVTLSRQRDSKFRRFIRDASGQPVESMEFVRGEIVTVPSDLVNVIAKDIGSALVICTNKDGVLKADDEATKQFVESQTVAKPAAPKPAKAKAKAKKPKPAETPAAEETKPSEPQRPDGEPDG